MDRFGPYMCKAGLRARAQYLRPVLGLGRIQAHVTKAGPRYVSTLTSPAHEHPYSKLDMFRKRMIFRDYEAISILRTIYGASLFPRISDSSFVC